MKESWLKNYRNCDKTFRKNRTVTTPKIMMVEVQEMLDSNRNRQTKTTREKLRRLGKDILVIVSSSTTKKLY